ncbi:NAD(P)-dependent alcohol dehydrogenase [Paraburkholderia sp. GAS334]|uniref:NAD(P)-dependent alcohol dehydrogenase n=1 Tax=Paraburkholderia sp. GAS334 TaxID=3035131 RepID=UPI003D1C53F1
MSKARGYAVYSSKSGFELFTFDRRELRDNDVRIEILYCGVCHSDLHTARDHWDGLIYPDGTLYPNVPGHEIIGKVAEVGSSVSRFKLGDLVGVGCMVDSCQHCKACGSGLEQYCENVTTWTYNSPDRVTGDITRGGYSDSIVVREEFVLNIRHETKDLAAVAPLLCAGVTMWSPLKHWGVGPGSKVGIVGIGGLGHMGIKLAYALGARVVAFTTSESKREAALSLGVDEVVNSRDAGQMAAHAGTLDLIINTVAVPHDLDAYTSLLGLNGTMALVGNPEDPHPSPSVATLLGGRRSIAGSLIGGIAETQRMLNFCATHGILADIETIRMQDIETAFERMLKSDVKYRFVIDMASLKEAA